MTPEVADFVRRHCAGVPVFSRNEASRLLLVGLGLDARPGTDTGWTFVPRPARPATDLLRDLGWNGAVDVLALCPVNPFWWPLVTDHKRALLLPLRGDRDPSYYGVRTFHRDSEEVDRRFQRYLDGFARAVQRHARRHPVFPVVLGMEPLDRAACEGLAGRLGAPPPLLAGEHDADELVATLRAASRLVSSRLHAIILSMSAGVPAIGLGFDRRIRSLLDEAGHPEQALDVDDPALEARLADALDRTCADGPRLGRDLRREAVGNLRRQAEMGRGLRLEIVKHHPDFPLPREPASWRGYLPELDPEIASLPHRDESNPAEAGVL